MDTLSVQPSSNERHANGPANDVGPREVRTNRVLRKMERAGKRMTASERTTVIVTLLKLLVPHVEPSLGEKYEDVARRANERGELSFELFRKFIGAIGEVARREHLNVMTVARNFARPVNVTTRNLRPTRPRARRSRGRRVTRASRGRSADTPEPPAEPPLGSDLRRAR